MVGEIGKNGQGGGERVGTAGIVVTERDAATGEMTGAVISGEGGGVFGHSWVGGGGERMSVGASGTVNGGKKMTKRSEIFQDGFEQGSNSKLVV